MAYTISQNLNIRPKYFPHVVVHVSAGDANIPVHFSIYDGASPYTIPSGTSITVHGYRKDGGNWITNGSFSGNVVSFTLPRAAMAIEGAGIADVVFTTGNEVVGSANFCLLVERATFPNGVSYSNDSSVFQDLLNFINSSAIPEAISDWLEENISATSPAVDASLTVQGAAADAKATGDALTSRTVSQATLTGNVVSFKNANDSEKFTLDLSALDDIKVVTNMNQMTDHSAVYMYTWTEGMDIRNQLYFYDGEWKPLGTGVRTASSAAQMSDTNAIYKYTGSEEGYEQNALYYNNGTAWTLLYSPSTIEMDDYTKFTDLFGEGSNGVVPQKPQHFVQQGGQYPTFGYVYCYEQDYVVGYEAPNVSIKSNLGSSWEYQTGYTASWKACFSDLTHIRLTRSGVVIGYCSIAFGFNNNYVYALNLSGKLFKAWNVSWEEETGWPNISNGKDVEMSVTKSTLTVTVDGATTTYDLTPYNLDYVSFGVLNLYNNTAKVVFENMEVGDGHYEYDNTKFLRSDATWQTAPVTPEGFPSAFKDALLECFRQVAWISEYGRQYYDNLRLLLYPTQQADGWTDGEAYDDITVINGYKISSTKGTSSAATGWSKTDFVPCKGASSITFPALDESVHEYNHGAFYNQARWRISTITLSGTGERTVDVPSDAVFFAISSETEALEDLIEAGIVPHA